MLNQNVVFCFTGKGPMPRSDMEAMAIKAGARVTKSVNNMTTILVIMDMDSQSTKARKARSMGIDLIGPNTFFEMCKDKHYTFNSYDSIKKHSEIKQKAEAEKKIIASQVKSPLRKIVLE